MRRGSKGVLSIGNSDNLRTNRDSVEGTRAGCSIMFSSEAAQDGARDILCLLREARARSRSLRALSETDLFGVSSTKCAISARSKHTCGDSTYVK